MKYQCTYNTKRSPCPECGVSIRTEYMDEHIERTHKERTFQCDECAATFGSENFLKRHKETHIMTPCPDCGKMFNASNLKRHKKAMHTPNHLRAYQCEVCHKGFDTPMGLKKHTYIHTGEKPYKCKICSFATADSANLAAHNRGVHQGIKRQKR